MVQLAARADGNDSSASTWAVIDGTSYLNSETTSTLLTNAAVQSSAFTPGAITIDGIGVKPSLRVASPTGTISIGLYQAAVLVTGTQVTINASDIAAIGTAANVNAGWVFFKFAAPVTLLAATAYTVGALCSVASTIGLRSLATSNWSRFLRTTTTQAPAVNDDRIVVGEWTGAGARTSRTVTYDQTATTAWGTPSTSSVTPGLAIGDGGKMTVATTAATAFNMRMQAIIVVYANGSFEMGTVGTPIPRGSSFDLTFNLSVDLDYGLIVRDLGTVIARGLSRTSGKDIWFCKLTANAAAAATSLTVDTDTGWLNGDAYCISSATRTSTEGEDKTLSANAGASTLTSVALTNAHSGTAGALPTQSTLCLLTRNVSIRGVSTAVGAYITLSALSTFDCEWVEFRWMGGNVAGKRGIEVSTTSAGAFNMRYCSLREFRTWGVFVASTTNTNLTFQFNVIYFFNQSSTASISGINNGSLTTASTTYLIDGNVICKSLVSNSVGITITRATGTITNNLVNSCAGSGYAFGDSAGNALGTFTFTGNTAHSNASFGFVTTAVIKNLTFGTLRAWRNGASGFSFSNAGCSGIVIDGLVMYGNLTQNLLLSSIDDCRFKDYVSNSDATLTTASAIAFNASAVVSNVRFDNPIFSNSVAHTQDMPLLFSCAISMTFVNPTTSTGTEIPNVLTTLSSGTISQIRRNGVVGDNRLYRPNQRNSGAGVLTDSVIFNGQSPSIRAYPGSATANLKLPPFFAPVASGTALTVSVTIRESESGDGVAWAGFTNQPRLWLRANPAIGIDSDTLIATHDGAAGWRTLSGTTAVATDDGVMEFFVDVNGTSGWINVDMLSCVSPTTQGTKYWSGPANGLFVHGEPQAGILMPPGMSGGMNA